MNCLMYHRIEDALTNPWGISVSPAHFESQIGWLKRHRNVLSLPELLNDWPAAASDPRAVLISFDDGYADNFLVAKPILEKYDCPAVFFIPTWFIGDAQRFWWDELERIFLQRHSLPGAYTFHSDVGQTRYVFPEPDADDAAARFIWRWHEPPPDQRCAAFLDLWNKLGKLSIDDRERQLREIRKWSGPGGNGGEKVTMTWEQLRVLASHPLFSIGLHTHTHPDLTTLPYNSQLQELKTCRQWLERHHIPVLPAMAYPFGYYNSNTLHIAKELKLRACFTTAPDITNSETDQYQIPRWQLPDRSAQESGTFPG